MSTLASPSIPLSPLQLFETFRYAGDRTKVAGFPPLVAVVMGAVALRESAGIPTAFNGNVATGDRSLGLVQINMLNEDVRVAVYTKVLGIPAAVVDLVAEQRLLEPDVNAKAAFVLWAHNNSFLNLLWYIGRTGTAYATRYESHLPVMMAAALTSPLYV
jgi:hypothetical protein